MKNIDLLTIVAYVQEQLMKINNYSRNKAQVIIFFILPDKNRKEIFSEILPSGVYSPEIQEMLHFFETTPEKRKYKLPEYNIKKKIDSFVDFFKINTEIKISKFQEFMNLYSLIFDWENKNPKFYGLKLLS